jgi:hypothetical protein
MADKVSYSKKDGSPAGLVSPLEAGPSGVDEGEGQPDVGNVPFGGAPDPLGIMPKGEGDLEK